MTWWNTNRYQLRPQRLNESIRSILSVDQLTRFAVLLPARDKAADTAVCAIIERIIGISGPPETLHSHQGPDFENRVIYHLQRILGYQKTRKTPYRPQGNSASERVQSTMHNMLATHSAIDKTQLGIALTVRPISS